MPPTPSRSRTSYRPKRSDGETILQGTQNAGPFGSHAPIAMAIKNNVSARITRQSYQRGDVTSVNETVPCSPLFVLILY